MHLAALIKQKPYEHVEYLIRRHWITFVPKVLLILTLTSIPIILYFLLNALFPTLINGPIIYVAAILLASTYYLGLSILFFTQFVEFYLDIMIITNDRLIDAEQHGLFSRSIAELDLFHIQDVTADIHGLFSTLFNYGDITIKTASSTVNFVAHDAPGPNQIREHIIQLAQEDRKFHPVTHSEEQKF